MGGTFVCINVLVCVEYTIKSVLMRDAHEKRSIQKMLDNLTNVVNLGKTY